MTAQDQRPWRRWFSQRLVHLGLAGLALIFVPRGMSATGAGSANGEEQRAWPTSTVGMEGRIEVNLPGTLLETKPVDEKSAIILRIADTRPHGTLIGYDLRYMGLEPGQYDLRNLLVRKDGSATNDLPPLRVRITGLLPAFHRGELIEQPHGALVFVGGYRRVLILLASLWVLALIPLWLRGRRRSAVQILDVPAAPPTLVERLQPLIEQAAAGRLDIEGRARLERLLLSHWQEQWHLEGQTQAEGIAALRQHPEAGVLLRTLEDWLHRPPGGVPVDVAALLAPYRQSGSPPPAASSEGGAG